MMKPPTKPSQIAAPTRDVLSRIVNGEASPEHGIVFTHYTLLGDPTCPPTIEEEARTSRALRTGLTNTELESIVLHLGDQLSGAIIELGRTLSTANAPLKSAVNIREAQDLLGCGRTQVWAMLRTGTLKRARKNGRQQLITTASIQAALGESPQTTRQPQQKSRAARGWKHMDRSKLRV